MNIHFTSKALPFVGAVVFVIALGCQYLTGQTITQLELRPGTVSVENVVVSVPLANGADTKQFILRDSTGGQIPVQRISKEEGIALLPKVSAGKNLKYRLEESKETKPAAMSAKAEPEKISFTGNERPITSYQINSKAQAQKNGAKEQFLRGGYLHPVFTPQGGLVTDDYPTNHLHHHGIWTAWTKTSYEGRSPDFWNMGDKKARVEHSKLLETWSGDVSAGLRSLLFYEDMKAQPAKTVLHEEWKVDVYNSYSKETPYHLIDLTLNQTNISSAPLDLPKYHYGGLGFRGHEQLNPKGKWLVMTSEGITNRTEADNSRGTWCDLSGVVDGKYTGVTIFCHPENFRAPQPMRVNPSEPFFCYAPQQLGDFQIPDGGTYQARYRFLIHDGPITAEQAGNVYRGFASKLALEKVADGANNVR